MVAASNAQSCHQAVGKPQSRMCMRGKISRSRASTRCDANHRSILHLMNMVTALERGSRFVRDRDGILNPRTERAREAARQALRPGFSRDLSQPPQSPPSTVLDAALTA